MARLRITAGGIWKAFYWTLAGAAFWFVYDGVQHPEKFDDKTLPPSAVESRLPGGAFRANLPEVSLNYTGAVADIENPAIDPATVLLPGHGAVTTMEHEHHGNPYLAEAKIRGGDLKA